LYKIFGVYCRNARVSYGNQTTEKVHSLAYLPNWEQLHNQLTHLEESKG